MTINRYDVHLRETANDNFCLNENETETMHKELCSNMSDRQKENKTFSLFKPLKNTFYGLFCHVHKGTECHNQCKSVQTHGMTLVVQ